MNRRNLFKGITGLAGASVAAFAAKKGIGLPEAQPEPLPLQTAYPSEVGFAVANRDSAFIGRAWAADMHVTGTFREGQSALSGVRMTTPAYDHLFADGFWLRPGLPVTEYDAAAQTVDGVPLTKWNEDGYALRREVLVTGTENGYLTKRGGRLYLAKRDAGD